MLYPYKCSCGHKFYEEKPSIECSTASCPECFDLAKQDYEEKFKSGVYTSDESHYAGVYTNITSKPIYIHDKKHLKEVCDKHNKVSHMLAYETSDGKLINKI